MSDGYDWMTRTGHATQVWVELAWGLVRQGEEPMSTRSSRESVDLDERLQDPSLLEEINLYSELIIVAAASPEPLTTDAIDHALGLPKAPAAS